MTEHANEKTMRERFARINEFAEKDGVVLFGSAFFAQFPIDELAQSFGIEEPVYNRSLPNRRLKDAFADLEEGVFALEPRTVLLGLGEEDVAAPDFDLSAFLADYDRLLALLAKKTKAKLVVLSPAGERREEVCQGLKELAKKRGCDYVDLSDVFESENPEGRLMSRLKYELIDGPINFYDAMNAVACR